MNNLEQKYVDEVNAYLALPVAEREIEKGAMLMLKGNRNQTLHKTVIRKIWHEKVEYELKKILADKYVPAESKELSPKTDADKKNPPVTNEELIIVVENRIASAESKGQRIDHDQLPAEIQAIPDANKARYQQLRSLHEKLKLMNAENFTAEDRKPVLDEFLKLDAELRENWDKYDTYVIGQAVKEVKTVAKIDAKRIGANRTFLSRQAKKEKLSDEDIAETQNRFDEMIANDVVVSPEITDKLKALGIKVAETTPEVASEPAAPAQDVNTEVTGEPAAPAKDVTTEVPGNPEKTEDDNPNDDEQAKAEAILCASIKGMLKSNLDAEVIKNAFLGVNKVGEKDLTPELLQELIDTATAELVGVDVDAQV